MVNYVPRSVLIRMGINTPVSIAKLRYQPMPQTLHNACLFQLQTN